jgi:hypothetical protein
MGNLNQSVVWGLKAPWGTPAGFPYGSNYTNSELALAHIDYFDKLHCYSSTDLTNEATIIASLHEQDCNIGAINSDLVPSRYCFETSLINGGYAPLSANRQFTAPPAIQESNTISTFPNPTSDIIHFSSSSPILELKVLNAEGKEVYQKLFNNEKTKKTSIDVSRLGSGIYFSKIRNEKEVKVGKFIIQH